MVKFCNITFGKQILYTIKMEIDENDGNDGHTYRLKKIDEIQEILIAERDKRNELSTKYNWGVNIIGMIDNCLGVTAIWLGITGVGLLSTIIACTSRNWNGNSNNCYGITSICRKSSY